MQDESGDYATRLNLLRFVFQSPLLEISIFSSTLTLSYRLALRRKLRSVGIRQIPNSEKTSLYEVLQQEEGP